MMSLCNTECGERECENRGDMMDTQLGNIVESAQAERLATGFVFTEGPVWHPEGYWLFVDVRANLIYRLVPGGQPEIIREQSGSSQGVSLDPRGRLPLCEGGKPQGTPPRAHREETPPAP